MDSNLNIIDIRGDLDEDFVRKELVSMIREDPKRMPTLLLYDEKGLRLFEEVTYLDQYYLTNNELRLLEDCAVTIASRIPSGSIVLELGSGNLRKVNVLLKALEKAGKAVDYYALDLSLQELDRTLRQVNPSEFEHVRFHGLHGTYDDGLAWIQKPKNAKRTKCILSLGSSVGNYLPDDAAAFLGSWSKILGEEDRMLIGLDATQDPNKIFHAYNDREGVTHKFIMNGLDHANLLLGKDSFQPSDWEVFGRANEEENCHQAFYRAKKDICIDSVSFRCGELVQVESSYKFDPARATKLFETAGLAQGALFGSADGQHYLHMLSRAPFQLSPVGADQYAPTPAPTLAEWEQLWACWDQVTLQVTPAETLNTKPIDLRNEVIFYLGHIPTFVDIHLARATKGDPTEPAHFRDIFERGIDPDVDEPTRCHAHSLIPATWPELKDILVFQQKVRERVARLCTSDTSLTNPEVERALWLGFEHEAMHLETLLYMLVQGEVRPPSGPVRPDFSELAKDAKLRSVENEWFNIPETTVDVGLDDPDDQPDPPRYFGWDNEKPSRQVRVHAFQSKARPITNQEYSQYLLACEKTSELPMTWRSSHNPSCNGTGSHSSTGGISNRNNTETPIKHTNGTTDGKFQAEPKFYSDTSVKTVYGLVPLSQVLSWPVVASYTELEGCARWMGGRIPTSDEILSIYSHVEYLKSLEVEKVLSRKISAVNGHLSNEGVEETPPSSVASLGDGCASPSPDPSKHFVDLSGCNVGFQHWHPTEVTSSGNRLCGRGETGGVWEWTSSVLENYDGFTPMPLYPGYTS
ncbi:MAG: hypothetical protein M1814_000739 [Vezdaea aestivalis]|nr:MAG: hypothetical protein M1814_000739 [Vezdaea aestivalis]